MTIKRGADRSPVFCIHGEPLRIAMRLPKHRPVYSLNFAYSDAELKDIPATVEAIAATYVAAIMRAQPTGKINIFGFSAGGTIAFEVARQLLESGREIGVLFLAEPTVSGTSSIGSLSLLAKHAIKNQLTWSHCAMALKTVQGVIKRRPAAIARRLTGIWCAITGRPVPERLRWVRYLEHIRPSVRQYVYRPLNCPARVLYGGLDESAVSSYESFWKNILGPSMSLHNVSDVSRHLDLMFDPALSDLTALLEEAMSG